MPVSIGTLRALPKADLHSHIDGSVSARELFRIARANRRRMLTPKGTELDSVTAFTGYVKGTGFASMLENVVERFYPITGMMQTEDAIRDVGVSYIEGQKREGVAYAEGRFAPQYHVREGLSLKQVIASMAEGLMEGSERFGVRASLIVAIGRESPPSAGLAVAKAASDSGLAVALDLGGPEAGNPPEKFAEAFKKAKASGLKVTIHAGEGAGSKALNLANIEASVVRLGADRIGHAIDLAGSGRLMSAVKENSTVIEMNPVSNLTLKKVRNLTDLRIDRLLGEGIRVTINSDDPALWPNGSISEVYSAVCQAYGFGMPELDALALNAFRGAFASEEEKGLLIEGYRRARRRLA